MELTPQCLLTSMKEEMPKMPKMPMRVTIEEADNGYSVRGYKDGKEMNMVAKDMEEAHQHMMGMMGKKMAADTDDSKAYKKKYGA